jgi:tRNA pseudouridine55 synthase
MSRRHRRGRAVDGVVLLDKPVGLTSNQALQAVKNLYRARKAGHTGSLDPLASGMLPVCLGEATKLSAFLLNADKRYQVACRLGVTTRTGDAEGEVVQERPVPSLTLDRIDAVIERFRGEIQQIPPMHSALHHEGRRLYELAREGVEVERAARTVTIYALHAEAIEGDEFRFEVACSKGTYVRSLAEDIGEALGCGAYVTALRRPQVRPYREEQMVTFERLESLAEAGIDALDEVLLPMDTALMEWPGIHLNHEMAGYVRHGQPVLVPRSPTDGMVRLYEGETAFIGVGEIIDDGRVAPKRLMQV